MSKPPRPSMKSLPPRPVKVSVVGGVVAAEDRVVEHRALDGVDAAEGVVADRGVAVAVPVPGVAPVCRSTVTPPVALMKLMRVLPLPMMVSLPPMPVNSLKVPLRAGIGAGAAEAGRVVGVGEVGAAHGFDGDQRVGADRCVAGDRAGGQIDGDARGRRPGRGCSRRGRSRRRR